MSTDRCGVVRVTAGVVRVSLARGRAPTAWRVGSNVTLFTRTTNSVTAHHRPTLGGGKLPRAALDSLVNRNTRDTAAHCVVLVRTSVTHPHVTQLPCLPHPIATLGEVLGRFKRSVLVEKDADVLALVLRHYLFLVAMSFASDCFN